MAKQLKLEVLLAAVDKVTRPLKAINETAGKVSAEFRQTKSKLNELNRQAGMVDGYRKNNSALEATSAKLDNARNKASRLAREFKATENPTKAMKRELDNARSTVKSLDSAKTKLTKTVQEQRQKLEQNGISTKNLAFARSKLRNETKRLNDELAQQKDRLDAVTKQQEHLNKISKTYQKTKELQGRLAVTGAQMAAAGSGTLALMGAPAILSEQQGAAIAAQMGQSELSAEYQLVIKEVYESGAGDGIAGISEAISAVSSSLGSLKNTSQANVVEMTRQALTLSRAYGIDVSRATQTAALLVKNGLAKNANEAFDLMTSSMQSVSKEMRDELPDIIHEYSTSFRALGFSGEHAFNMLVAQAENGKYALDKTGDALKEFTIRGSDMSKASTEAYAALGMNASRASAAVAAGGSEARAVLKQTAERLLAIENPARRANLAISLFGTPLEDLSVDQIPSFLKGLGQMENKLGDTSGSTLELDAALRNNTGDALIQVQRIISGSFMTIIKELSDDIIALVKSFSAWAKENPELLATIAKVSAVIAGLVAVGGALTLTIAGLLGPIAAVRMAFSILQIKTFPGVTVASKVAGKSLLGAGKSALIAAKSTGAKSWSFLTGNIRAATVATAAYKKSNGLLATVMESSKAVLVGLGKTIMSALLPPLSFLKAATIGVTRALIMNPIGAIIAGIAAAGLLIYKFWEPIRAFFIGMWHGIREAFTPVGKAMTEIFSDVGQVLAPLKPLWDGIASVLGTVWRWISLLFKPFQATSEQLDGATNAGRLFGKIFAQVFMFIPKLVIGTVKSVIGIFKTISGAVGAVWDSLKKVFWWSPIGLIVKAFSKAFDWLTNIDWAGIVSGSWESMKTIFKWSPLGLIVRGWRAAFNWMANIDWSGSAASAWDRVKSVFSWSPLAAIRDRFNGAINWMANIDWSGSAASAWDRVKSVFSWSPLENIKNGFNAVLQFLGTLPAKFSQLGSDILSGLINGITGALSKIKDNIVEVASSVSSWFKETLGINSPSKVFMLHGKDTMRGLALGLKGNDEPVKEVNRTSGKLKKAAAGMALTAAISMPVAAEQPKDLIRNIKYNEESLNLLGIQDTVQRIKTREIERTNETRNIDQRSNKQLTQDNRIIISEGAIVIQSGAGADAKDIARQVRLELQRLERERAAENRSKLKDLY
ncbi:phage tail tape measure protein [Shewanella sp.]|uniref:phage tail tape measure protein n=1 Tax=Shewanella sp. TaxID=50422 RepID=UPI003564F2E6